MQDSISHGSSRFSSGHVGDNEKFLEGLVSSGQRIVQRIQHGRSVFIVTDLALVKQIFEDGKNFSFTPGDLSDRGALTEGARAFVDEGLESQLLASTYDEYKEFRKVFNQAFNRGYSERKEEFDTRAKAHLAKLLDAESLPRIDAVSLCKRFSIPLMANVIGIDSLPYADLLRIADCAQLLADGHGMQEEGAPVEQLAVLHETIVDLLRRVITADAVPGGSALGCLLESMDVDTAIGHARAFILGGIDTGSSSLMLSTYLLATDAVQRAEFLQLDSAEQQRAVTELISKEAPAYYSPRFAMSDVVIDGVAIPAGSFVQLATYAINRCANPDFTIRRYAASQCPVGANETLPFGHARHKCPGEELGRHLTAVFLDGLFSRFPSITVESIVRQRSTFSRGLNELVLLIEGE